MYISGKRLTKDCPYNKNKFISMKFKLKQQSSSTLPNSFQTLTENNNAITVPIDSRIPNPVVR